MPSNSPSGEAPSLLALRNEPVQARSTARLTTLLDAAASVVDDIGFERLTTAMVAERAHSSIGTVYRYFPDRIAVLQALSGRYRSRFAEYRSASLGASLSAGEEQSWLAAVDSVLEYWLDAFRNEPGFRSLRFGDVLDLHPRQGSVTYMGEVAATVASVLESRHGFAVDDALLFDLEVAFTACDALLARAFAFDPAGDDRYIRQGFDSARRYLAARHEPVTGPTA